MKVAINLLGLPTLKQGGAGMLAGLEVKDLLEMGVDLRVVANEDVVAQLELPPGTALAATGPKPSRTADLAHRVRSPYGHLRGVVADDALADRDVVHYPLGFSVAPRPPTATVVTAVDLQHVHFPSFFSRRDRILRALTWHRSIRAATRVAVYTEAVRSSVIEHLGLSPGRVDVVGACCHPRFFEPAGEAAERGRFLIYPASPLPNKNHARLIDAFRLALRDHPDLRLILVGPLTHDWTPVERHLAEAGLGDSVEIRGHVSLDDLVGLYRSALGLVFPSVFEGFGMPVLEAMASGCPVIAADIPSVIEVCGDEAIVVDPFDPETIAAGIDRLATASPDRLDDLTARGRKRAESFRPEVMSRKLLASFEQAVGTIGAE